MRVSANKRQGERRRYLLVVLARQQNFLLGGPLLFDYYRQTASYYNLKERRTLQVSGNCLQTITHSFYKSACISCKVCVDGREIAYHCVLYRPWVLFETQYIIVQLLRVGASITVH